MSASCWIIVRTERVLHCKWQFVRVLWGFRSPLFFPFSPLPPVAPFSFWPSPGFSVRATTTTTGILRHNPPSPGGTLEIFQEQHSALGTVRFAKRGKSRDAATAGTGIAFFCLVSACRIALCEKLADGWVVSRKRRGTTKTEEASGRRGGEVLSQDGAIW